jgi:Flp pilus assembly secretin CpaC
VTLDFARVLTFGMPARTIIIGNPAVVDGTLSDDRTIVLTGKAIGTTNMIVLGEAGREVASFVVNVTTNNSQSITVHQGETQQTYTCAGTCRPPAAPAAGSK